MNKLISTLAGGLLISTAALAQSATPQAPSPMPPPAAKPLPAPADAPIPPKVGTTTTMASPKMHLSDAQAKSWIGKAIYSSDGKNLGDVAEISHDSTGSVTGLLANVGGFLGIGKTHVRVDPTQFSLDTDKVTLRLTADQVKALPHIKS